MREQPKPPPNSLILWCWTRYTLRGASETPEIRMGGRCPPVVINRKQSPHHVFLKGLILFCTAMKREHRAHKRTFKSHLLMLAGKGAVDVRINNFYNYFAFSTEKLSFIHLDIFLITDFKWELIKIHFPPLLEIYLWLFCLVLVYGLEVTNMTWGWKCPFKKMEAISAFGSSGNTDLEQGDKGMQMLENLEGEVSLPLWYKANLPN